jgi:branched-chain amino acid transport system ATP-binding protein
MTRESEATPLLEVHSVLRRFGGYVALDQVSCGIDPGTVHALIGPNGAGKTTFINVLSGLIKPNAGRLIFMGRRYDGARPDQITAMGIARNFQQVRLFPDLSVFENVMIGRHCRQPGFGIREFFGMDRNAAQTRTMAHDTLEFVGFRAAEKGDPRHLTLVEQRRVEIARALVSDPKLLLLDEPAAGMNPAETDELGAIIEKMRQAGRTVLLIEHHMRLVMAIADRITVLDAGKVIASGAPADVRENPAVIAAYLGQAA